MSASEYKEDARRIERDYVDPESTSRADILADLEDADFGNPTEISDWVLSAEDVGLDQSNTHVDGITTREEVADEVSGADEIGYSDERREAITDSISKDVGAPREGDLRKAQTQTLSEFTRANELGIEGETRTSQLGVVRSTDGDVVGIVGGSGSVGKDVAEQLGAKHYGGPKQFTESMSAKPAPDGRKALLYANDDPVGEVDL